MNGVRGPVGVPSYAPGIRCASGTDLPFLGVEFGCDQRIYSQSAHDDWFLRCYQRFAYWALPPRRVPPRAELEAHLRIDAGEFEAEAAVQSDARVVRQRDARK